MLSLNLGAGVQVESFPRMWICRRCRRLERQSNQTCVCGSRRWGQLHFVGYHDCGALREPWFPNCAQHNQARINFPGTGSPSEIVIDCPVCNQVIRRGLFGPNCDCGDGRIVFTVHRAARVYSPRSIVIVNPPSPREFKSYGSLEAPVEHFNG